MAGVPRTEDQKRRFTKGNLYAEREEMSTPRTFKSLCRTMDFATRLNIPAAGIHMIGSESRVLKVEIGYTGLTYDCWYEYCEISSKKNPIASLQGLWYKVVESMDIQQGDTVYFEGDHRDPFKFHASMDKNDKAIKVEDMYWI